METEDFGGFQPRTDSVSFEFVDCVVGALPPLPCLHGNANVPAAYKVRLTAVRKQVHQSCVRVFGVADGPRETLARSN